MMKCRNTSRCCNVRSLVVGVANLQEAPRVCVDKSHVTAPLFAKGGGSVYETKNEKNVADDLSCSTCRETTSCFEIWRLIFVGESVYLTRVKLAGVVG